MQARPSARVRWIPDSLIDFIAGIRAACFVRVDESGGCVPDSVFAERLGEIIELTPAERMALIRLEERERPLRRGAALLRENDRSTDLFVLRRGVMISYVVLDNGTRQILRFLFPGDLLGISNLVYRGSPEAIQALTDCTVAPFDRNAVARIMADLPRLAALIFIHNQIERVALTDRLAALGRSSAKARVAGLLLEIRNRQRVIDKSIDGSFMPGLPQEELGDATGLTAVHVNRMLRQLEDEEVIARDNGRVTINDEARLARIGNFVDRYRDLDLGWLPPRI